MRRILLLTLVLFFVAGTVVAGQNLQVNPVPEGTEFHGLGSKQDCYLGNPYDPYFYITGWNGDWIWIKLLVWPPLTCQCGVGFQLGDFFVPLYVPAPGLPEDAVFDIWIDLEDGWWWDDAQCWYPGPIDCEWSQEVNIPAGTAGFHAFTVTMQDCDCAFMEYPAVPPWPYPFGPYLISVRIPNIYWPGTDVGVYPMIDGEYMAEACTSYATDTLDVTTFYDITVWSQFTGDWAIYATADCCDWPVGNEDVTWGEVKSLYK